MITWDIPENPYLLLTPGPLSTTRSVKAVMLRDWCTWDRDYNEEIVQDIRRRLVAIGGNDAFTATLMQGSGTFAVEAAIGSMMPRCDGKLLVLANGAYGDRIATIARYLGLALEVHDSGEVAPPDLARLERTLVTDADITHVACVHCETTTGMLNPIERIGPIVKAAGRIFLVDAMSSFGGIMIDLDACGIDVLISSANKCIQGVPGFGFILARRELLQTWKGQARSLSLDVYDQWETMEKQGGKWRFTSPTHVQNSLKWEVKHVLIRNFNSLYFAEFDPYSSPTSVWDDQSFLIHFLTEFLDKFSTFGGMGSGGVQSGDELFFVGGQ
jgi:2-aminoethylphosphonate-pyruvate transaminase